MDTDVNLALDAWVEWKEKCALDMCSAPTCGYLCGFVSVRFQRHFQRYAYKTNISNSALPRIEARNAWHFFESYMAVRTTRQGKRYKDWLFSRANMLHGQQLDIIQAGAFVIMRDVVRDYLRTEFLPRTVLSMQQPMDMGGGHEITLEELLAGDLNPADHVLLREYEVIADQHAGHLYGAMTRREKIAVLAKRLRLPLTENGVQTAAGCRKSKLSGIYHDWMLKTAGTIRQLYPEDDPKCLLTLAIIVVDRIGERVTAWAGGKPAFGRLFKTAAQRNSLPVLNVRKSRQEAIA